MTSGAAGPAAVLFDMDGTLLDSEKVWDISLQQLAEHLGGRLSAQTRALLTGSNMARTIEVVHGDLGVDADPAESAAYLTARTLELFGVTLAWRPGAPELLDALAEADVPLALVTSTERGLTEVALGTLGRDRFAVTVCGDEVTHPKPHPEPYLTAARLLGVDIRRCLAIEDSVTGVASAEAAGCAVLAVPSEVPIAPAPTRTVRASLEGLTLADLADLMGKQVC